MAVAYVPAVREILSITDTDGNATVTTTSNHYYVPAQLVRFLIPREFEMTELNDMTGEVLSVTDDTMLVNINVSEFTPFVYPASFTTPAQVIPIGDANFGFTTLGTVGDPLTISGAFRVINV